MFHAFDSQKWVALHKIMNEYFLYDKNGNKVKLDSRLRFRDPINIGNGYFCDFGFDFRFIIYRVDDVLPIIHIDQIVSYPNIDDISLIIKDEDYIYIYDVVDSIKYCYHTKDKTIISVPFENHITFLHNHTSVINAHNDTLVVEHYNAAGGAAGERTHIKVYVNGREVNKMYGFFVRRVSNDLFLYDDEGKIYLHNVQTGESDQLYSGEPLSACFYNHIEEILMTVRIDLDLRKTVKIFNLKGRLLHEEKMNQVDFDGKCLVGLDLNNNLTFLDYSLVESIENLRSILESNKNEITHMAIETVINNLINQLIERDSE
jgi:hypothetical protein